MSLFDVIRYPVGDNYIGTVGVPGVKEISEDFPKLYQEWMHQHWFPYIREHGMDGISEPLNQLRKMLLEL